MKNRRSQLARLPADHGRATVSQVRQWRVLHASSRMSAVVSLVDGQNAAGMFPQVVIPHRAGSGEPPESRAHLMTAWHDVRRWRALLDEADPMGVSEIVHAHSFSSGMAAVRSVPVVVYDISSFVEDVDGDGTPPGAWVSRSFQVAEQFVISRAGATVVRGLVARERALARGAQPQNLFVVPQPLTAEQAEIATGGASAPDDSDGVSFYCAGVPLLNAGRLSPELLSLMQAMAAVAAEVDGVRLQLELDCATDEQQVRGELVQLGVGLPVSLVSPQDRATALGEAHVALLHRAWPGSSALGLDAMLHARALLAADVPEHRDLSQHGRGCIWFRPGDLRDLACRAAFLARNQDFLRGLGAAGYRHLLATRSTLAVAERYDPIYRHAIRRRRNSPDVPWTGLQLARACI
jgi:hypothetical protein